MHHYSVTMAITKFLQPEVIQEELIDTKFADFGEGLMTAHSRYNKTCINAHISYETNGRFISLVLETQAF